MRFAWNGIRIPRQSPTILRLSQPCVVAAHSSIKRTLKSQTGRLPRTEQYIEGRPRGRPAATNYVRKEQDCDRGAGAAQTTIQSPQDFKRSNRLRHWSADVLLAICTGTRA